MDFEKFPKIPRLSKGWSVSEKINGTNALVHIEVVPIDPGYPVREMPDVVHQFYYNTTVTILRVGSRNRWITPNAGGVTTDNFGFAAWVREHATDLLRLGPGAHHGEWFGEGIQGNPLGVEGKRLALFNPKWLDQGPECVEVVPQLGIAMTGQRLDEIFLDLDMDGSRVEGAAWNNLPEGIIAYHLGSGQLYKRTFVGDGGKHGG